MHGKAEDAKLKLANKIDYLDKKVPIPPTRYITNKEIPWQPPTTPIRQLPSLMPTEPKRRHDDIAPMKPHPFLKEGTIREQTAYNLKRDPAPHPFLSKLLEEKKKKKPTMNRTKAPPIPIRPGIYA